MNRDIVAALYDLCAAEYPADVLEEIQISMDYFRKATGLDAAEFDARIMNPVSAAEAWGFEQGFMTCINMMNGKLFQDQEDDTK